ncbi:hypothetical protein [Picosynechococcus sp. PCC 7003]|uniref:hypothetical protein n=1 Tax=Picosynechococcus sp. PCC 7003 TaxID=374981 RepID=UPI000903833B|nr:hypothetical protein [Picosynechococcus sp. PCC 7003]
MWLNFLALLPSTVLTVLLIAIAFLRFYDETDFEFLGLITQPRVWSNGCTVAALVATLANFGVEWNRRNRETNRLAEEAQRRATEEQRRDEAEKRRIREEQRRMAQERADESRRAETRERQATRTRIETRCRLAEIRYQLNPTEANRQDLADILAVLKEYGEIP